MAYENNDKKMESVYSKRIRAGKRRTYFFDVRATRGNDYFLTITESRKRFNEDGYDRHKIFLYKEDFNKFIKILVIVKQYYICCGKQIKSSNQTTWRTKTTTKKWKAFIANA